MIRILRAARLAALLLAAALVTFLVLRVVEAERGLPLRAWHLFVPAEMRAAALDATDWRGWLAAEEAVVASVRTEVSDRLEAEDRVPSNRYWSGSPLHPVRFARDWNRSFVLEPDGAPAGAAVFLHGLTDAPYSLRHLAQAYRDRGWVAVGIRLPGHGTVPGGLTVASAADWMAATRLAMREGRARAGPGRPLHLVGYSNGGALALKHALDAVEDPRLPRADRLVLISPMVGVTAFARFAGLAGLPALVRAAWLEVLPEFNPFKYNSFPVNAARQSWRVTAGLQEQIRRLSADGRLAALPPVLTFQSVADATVSTSAVVEALYARLPPNGSELVLFDLNHDAKLGPLLNPGADRLLDRLLPPAPRPWRATVVTNAEPDRADAVERTMPAGATEETVRPLGLSWPREVFSLSHVALPFPVEDGVYGTRPDPADDFGVRLGTVAPRGERGLLVTGLDGLLRATSNPFFPYLAARVGMLPPAPNGTEGAVPGQITDPGPRTGR